MWERDNGKPRMTTIVYINGSECCGASLGKQGWQRGWSRAAVFIRARSWGVLGWVVGTWDDAVWCRGCVVVTREWSRRSVTSARGVGPGARANPHWRHFIMFSQKTLKSKILFSYKNKFWKHFKYFHPKNVVSWMLIGQSRMLLERKYNMFSRIYFCEIEYLSIKCFPIFFDKTWWNACSAFSLGCDWLSRAWHYPSKDPRCEIQIWLRNCHPMAGAVGFVNIHRDSKPSLGLNVQGSSHIILHKPVPKPGNLSYVRKCDKKKKLAWLSGHHLVEHGECERCWILIEDPIGGHPWYNHHISVPGDIERPRMPW